MCVCVCVCVCVCEHVPSFCNLSGTLPGINTGHVRTNSPHGDQRVVLMQHNINLGVRYDLKLVKVKVKYK